MSNKNQDKNAQTFKMMRRSDYRPPAFTADRVNLDFSLSCDGPTTVICKAHYLRLTDDPQAPLVLDGEDLELVDVRLEGQTCKYRQENGSLIIDQVPDEFTLEVENQIYPLDNTELMGLYVSNGTFCTQCEPHGFRRITYFLDRPDVLAMYRVTVRAPEIGTGVMLSNGNLVEQGRKMGRPYVVWEDPFPKPCYLFALVAGAFDIVEDSFVTMNGRRVELTIYVDRGNCDYARWAMQCIRQAMAWDEQRYGLEYDLDNFKVVAVDFFNQGAMENKSLNIFNSALVMTDADSGVDSSFYKIQSVIGHEYFHNYTGDRVTLRDWFNLSLKESLTVFRDQEFSSDVASRILTRLGAVNLIRSRQFAEDASPMAHPVRPEQVMEMNNFYTVTIYDKGAEVIRMIHTLIGEEKFRAALREYLHRYDGRAVTIDDFLQCFEEVSRVNLTGQFSLWYSQSGTPELTVRHSFKDGRLRLEFTQTTPPTPGQPEKQPFLIPVRVSFLSPDGSRFDPPELPENRVLLVDSAEQEFCFEAPAGTLPLVLEDFSAPVRLHADYTAADYQLILAHAEDPFIRVDSAVRLHMAYIRSCMAALAAGKEMPEPAELCGALQDLLSEVNEKSDLCMVRECLRVPALVSIMEEIGRLDEFDAMCLARTTLEDKLAHALRPRLLELFGVIKPESPAYSVADMGRRALGATIMHLLVRAARLDDENGDKAADTLVRYAYDSAQNMTQRQAALSEAVHENLLCRQRLEDDFQKKWCRMNITLDQFFFIESTAPAAGTIEQIRALMRHPRYDAVNPNRLRALIGGLCRGNPVALHRKDGLGYELIYDEVLRLNGINDLLAADFVTPLLSFRRFDKVRAGMMQDVLRRLAGKRLRRGLYEKVTAALAD